MDVNGSLVLPSWLNPLMVGAGGAGVGGIFILYYIAAYFLYPTFL